MAERLCVENLDYGYGGSPLLASASFSVDEGEPMAIAGRGGCGKSTLLELCAGLRPPRGGRILWRDREIGEFTRKELLGERGRMGFLFQVHALIHNYPVFDNVALPLRHHLSLGEREVRERVMEHLERFGLASSATMLPDMLSFGTARRVALARALVMEPEILFLDEPTSGLDPVTTRQMVEMLKEYRRRKPVTCLIISHNAFLIRELDCTVMVMEHGKVRPLTEWVGATDAPAPEIASFLHGALWYEKRTDDSPKDR